MYIMWFNLFVSMLVVCIVPWTIILLSTLFVDTDNPSFMSVVVVNTIVSLSKIIGYIYGTATVLCLILTIISGANARTCDKLVEENEALKETMITACYPFVQEASEMGTLEKPVDTIEDLFVFMEKHPSISKDEVIMQQMEDYKANAEEQEVITSKRESADSVKSYLKCLCIFNFCL